MEAILDLLPEYKEKRSTSIFDKNTAQCLRALLLELSKAHFSLPCALYQLNDLELVFFYLAKTQFLYL